MKYLVYYYQSIIETFNKITLDKVIEWRKKGTLLLWKILTWWKWNNINSLINSSLWLPNFIYYMHVFFIYLINGGKIEEKIWNFCLLWSIKQYHVFFLTVRFLFSRIIPQKEYYVPTQINLWIYEMAWIGIESTDSVDFNDCSSIEHNSTLHTIAFSE